MFSRDQILDTTNRQDYLAQQDDTTMPDVNAKKVVEPVIPNTKSELEILVSELGNVRSGQTKEISLSRILTILPRTRHKADAYKGLRAELRKQYGVDLVITSSKTKKNKLIW